MGPSGTGTAAGSVYDPLSGNGSVSRSALTASFLTGSGTLGLMNFSHYALPAGAANPSNTFQGRLTLHGEATSGSATEVGGHEFHPAHWSHARASAIETR